MSALHTSGPWAFRMVAEHIEETVGLREMSGVFIGREDDEGPDIAGSFLEGAFVDGPEASYVANARLIAAAPELLQACERMVAATEADQHFIGEEHELMKAAIAKATGAAA